MKYLLTCFSLLIFFISAKLPAQPGWSKAEEMLLDQLEKQSAEYAGAAHRIWEWAELGYQEERSTALLQQLLRDAGFQIEVGVAELPTAFVASYGQGAPTIAILAEYDALPGLSQDAVPQPQPREDTANGHACGHHLFGVGSAAAAIAVKRWMEQSGTKGTLRVYGTPAEEGGNGKVYMVRAGLFDDVDAVLHWHPSSGNAADAGSTLAVKSAKFRFSGISAHAAGAPWMGRSALDGVEAMNYMVNLMREHVEADSRIHYVITRGGEAPNVVPAFAEVYYYVRHPDVMEAEAMFQRLVKAAEGAAMGTGTTMEYEVIGGVYNILPNQTLAEMMHANLSRVGGVSYTDEERAFAEQIIKTYNGRSAKPEDAEKIKPFELRERGGYASTDVGDISWVVPTAGMGAATWVPGTAAHSWQAVAAGGTSIGHKGMIVAAKTIALTAMDIFQQPDVLPKARQELQRRQGKDFKYQPLIGDRKPPLDYRQ